MFNDNVDKTVCKCGKVHISSLDHLLVSRGAIGELPRLIEIYNAKKPFLVSDINTNKAAGERVKAVLEKADLTFSEYVFPQADLEPDEIAVGSLAMRLDRDADILIGIGSGTVNDICKIVSNISKIPYIIVGTAPSMDGYASETSSMILDGLKVSIPSKCPNAIVGDIDVLCTAPEKMLASGLGDMLAKYISLAEWRISNLINGEYYCEKIANDMRKALFECVKNTESLLTYDEESVSSVFHGLVASGCAMEYAGVSRPASGVEHYISHVLDMRGKEFGSAVETHGIQCAIATLTVSKLYHKLKYYSPDLEKALSYVDSFEFEDWANELRKLLGKAAESMISAEAKDGKYNKERHKERIKKIIDNWDTIISIIDEEIPTPEEIENLLELLKLPKDISAIEQDKKLLPTIFKATKDIRDKYVLSRLLWDLGIIDEYAETVI